MKPMLITIWPSVTNAPVGFTGNVPKFQTKSLRGKQAGVAAYVLFDCFTYKNYYTVTLAYCEQRDKDHSTKI